MTPEIFNVLATTISMLLIGALAFASGWLDGEERATRRLSALHQEHLKKIQAELDALVAQHAADLQRAKQLPSLDPTSLQIRTVARAVSCAAVPLDSPWCTVFAARRRPVAPPKEPPHG